MQSVSVRINLCGKEVNTVTSEHEGFPKKYLEKCKSEQNKQKNNKSLVPNGALKSKIVEMLTIIQKLQLNMTKVCINFFLKYAS